MKFLLCAPIFAALLSTATAATDFATQTLEATYKLFNKDSTATGFFIQEPAVEGEPAPGLILLTAKHVFTKMSGERCLIVLRENKGDGTFQRKDFPLTIRADGKDLWFPHPNEDVAAIRVTPPPELPVRALPFSALARERDLEAVNFHLASAIFVLGFPTRFEANSAGFPVARNATVASFPFAPVKIHRTFIADFTTFAGDSGGPVFLPDPRQAEQGTPLVVGMILAQLRHDETVKTLYEEQYIHHPLALGVTLHAHYLRETIEMMPKGAAEPLPAR